MNEQIPPARFYREFGRWLQELANYALTQADLLEDEPPAAPEEPARSVPPADWLAAAAPGPPAHWLELIRQNGVSEWQTRQDFSLEDPAAPVEPGQAEDEQRAESAVRQTDGVRAEKVQAAEVNSPPPEPRHGNTALGPPPQAETARAEPESAPTPRVQLAPARPEPAPPDEPALLVPPAAPAQPTPGRPVTRLRVRSTPEVTVRPAEAERDSAFRQKADKERPPENRQDPPKEGLAAHQQPIEPRPDAGVPMMAEAAPENTPARPQPAEAKSPAPLLLRVKLAPPPEGKTAPTPLTRAAAEHFPADAASRSISAEPAHPPALEARAPEEIHPPPQEERLPPNYPARPPFQPPPPSWSSSAGGHWPELPRREAPAGGPANGQRAAERQERLDREQKGRPWNA